MEVMAQEYSSRYKSCKPANVDLASFCSLRPISPEQLALSLKSQANAQFTQSHYRESLDLYTVSLNKNPFDPIVWSNRAAVRLKLEEHGLAIADASEQRTISMITVPLLTPKRSSPRNRAGQPRCQGESCSPSPLEPPWG